MNRLESWDRPKRLRIPEAQRGCSALGTACAVPMRHCGRGVMTSRSVRNISAVLTALFAERMLVIVWGARAVLAAVAAGRVSAHRFRVNSPRIGALMFPLGAAATVSATAAAVVSRDVPLCGATTAPAGRRVHDRSDRGDSGRGATNQPTSSSMATPLLTRHPRFLPVGDAGTPSACCSARGSRPQCGSGPFRPLPLTARTRRRTRCHRPRGLRDRHRRPRR